MKGKLKTIRFLTLVGILLIPSLTLRVKGANVFGQDLANGDAGSGYYQVPNDDAVMHRAVIEARKTVGQFIDALKHRAPGLIGGVHYRNHFGGHHFYGRSFGARHFAVVQGPRGVRPANLPAVPGGQPHGGRFHR